MNAKTLAIIIAVSDFWVFTFLVLLKVTGLLIISWFVALLPILIPTALAVVVLVAFVSLIRTMPKPDDMDANDRDL